MMMIIMLLLLLLLLLFLLFANSPFKQTLRLIAMQQLADLASCRLQVKRSQKQSTFQPFTFENHLNHFVD